MDHGRGSDQKRRHYTKKRHDIKKEKEKKKKSSIAEQSFTYLFHNNQLIQITY